MSGLKPFRQIPKTMQDWGRWFAAQVDVVTNSDLTVTESQISDFGSYVTTTVIKSGAGTPEANVVGDVGHIYLRSDGGTNTTLYVKESGAGTNTGWAAI